VAIPKEVANAITVHTLLRVDVRGAGDAIGSDVEYSSA
jgi:hypothetical protein